MEELVVREQIVYLLKGGGAHKSPKDVIVPVPFEDAGRKCPGCIHTIWELVEHMRICQWDILEFTLRKDHVSPEWPSGYWPESSAPEDEHQWNQTKADFFRKLDRAVEVTMEETVDLSGTIPHGTGQTVIREMLLIADHNAYHLGQIQDVISALKQ